MSEMNQIHVIIEAFQTCLSSSNHLNRKQAEIFIESFKVSSQCIEICCFILNNNMMHHYSVDIQMMTCSVLCDTIKQSIKKLSIENQIQLKNQMINLAFGSFGITCNKVIRIKLGKMFIMSS